MRKKYSLIKKSDGNGYYVARVDPRTGRMVDPPEEAIMKMEFDTIKDGRNLLSELRYILSAPAMDEDWAMSIPSL